MPESQRQSNGAPLRDAALGIVRVLRDAGHLAYFAGGCVRDELLGRIPSDYDVATDATPDRIQALFRRTAAVGASFGVILVKEGSELVEVATFRADGSYSDARRPDSVTFSSPEEDARRRDFTVNALFLDPLDTGADPRGRIIDHVGGLNDLSARVLRAVGDPEARLAEDHLRALRAVRLSTKLSFTIESQTAEAIRRHAPDLRGVSRERIGDELRMILALPSRAGAIALLRTLHLETTVFDSPGTPTLPDRLGALPHDASFPLCLAAIARDRGLSLLDAQVRSACRGLRQALCLSNDEHAQTQGTLLALRSLHDDWLSRPVSAQKRSAASLGFAPALQILQTEDPPLSLLIQTRRDQLSADGIGLQPVPLVTGDDLVHLGYRPGPRFRTVLDRVFDRQLEGGVREKGEALELARSWFV